MKKSSLIHLALLSLLLLPFSCSKPDQEAGETDKETEDKSGQEQKTEEKPFLELGVNDTVTVPATASELEVTVNTNLGGFEAYTESSWITVQIKKTNAFTLSFSDNPSVDSRSDIVWVAAPSRKEKKGLVMFTVKQEGAVIDYTEKKLDSEVTSNCYILESAGLYSFSASVRGNGKACQGLSDPAALQPKSAKLLWQSKKGFISEVSLQNGRILAKVDKTAANAVLAALDANGTIIWSWHLWSPGFELETRPLSDGDEMLFVNLGACSNQFTSSPEAYGLLYQWGRKDPFPGSPIRNGGTIYTKNAPVYDIDGNEVSIGSTSMYNTTDNTLAYSIAHPQVCISNNAQKNTSLDWLRSGQGNDALWGNPSGYDKTDGVYTHSGTKTFYDPCPAGWRVPPVRVFQHITANGGYIWAAGETEGVLTFYDLGGETTFAAYDYNQDGQINLLDYTDGWWFYTRAEKDAYAYFPATTRYDGSYAMFMGSMVGLWGNYWYNSPASPDSPGRALALSYGIKNYSQEYEITASATSAGGRADAYPIRCIKE